MSGGYKTGDFIHHSMKGYGFVVRKGDRAEIGWKVYHLNIESNLRHDVEGYTPWPDVEPDYPLIVCCTTNADVPVGLDVRI